MSTLNSLEVYLVRYLVAAAVALALVEIARRAYGAGYSRGVRESFAVGGNDAHYAE